MTTTLDFSDDPLIVVGNPGTGGVTPWVAVAVILLGIYLIKRYT